jgi:hypothetical protein
LLKFFYDITVIECQNFNSLAGCPAGSRPKWRSYHENERQKSMSSSINNSTIPVGQVATFTHSIIRVSIPRCQKMERNSGIPTTWCQRAGGLSPSHIQRWRRRSGRGRGRRVVVDRTRKNNYKLRVATPEIFLREKKIHLENLLIILT